MADETLFGWTVHWEQTKLEQSYFTRTTSQEYEKLYQLDILRVEDRSEFDQNEVKKEFFGKYPAKQGWTLPNQNTVD